MSRAPAHDILFEPVAIGPVVARNRFYQAPHCNGMGHRHPNACAEMRRVKAEGGWAVVCTEEVEIHPSTDVSPHIEGRIWDDADLPALRLITEKIHLHDSLAGIELAHNGPHALNLYSRTPSRNVSDFPVFGGHAPVQARRMDKEDIRELRRWHRDAAKRAVQAEFDLIHVYAGHALSIVSFFLSRRHNHRVDEYGGSTENRARLLRELVEETVETAHPRTAVAVRIAVDELVGAEGTHKEEVEEIIESMAELPDLWDLALAEWANDSASARFREEGFQEPYIRDIKRLTSKPVVGVGRYTSPDKMARLVRDGVLDLIGGARPSIADPFLPRKIEEGRYEDIRECIGCNICVTGDFLAAPIRCTQNPAMGEEWRRGWHPEHIRKRESDKSVLIVGAGPAGLEAARALAQREYEIVLAEAADEFGGRVAREARLPGLSSYVRVRDHRKLQLDQMGNANCYLKSRLTCEDILEYQIPRVVIATGCRWRRDGVSACNPLGVPVGEGAREPLTPDDVMSIVAGEPHAAGALPENARVLVWDDDHYYMASVIAEWLAGQGHSVCYATPASEVSAWTRNTMEQHFIQKRLLDLGVEVRSNEILRGISEGEAELACGFTGKRKRVCADAVVLVGARVPNDELFVGLQERRDEWSERGVEAVDLIGDAFAPATVAHAVYEGRRYAEETDMDEGEIRAGLFRREMVGLHP